MYEQIRTIVGDALNYNGGGIYQILLVGTDRCYVGRSIGVGGRLFSHVKALLKNKHINAKLQNAWNKYGHGRFAFKVLQKVEGPDMADAEQVWINHHKAASVGFNIVTMVEPYNVPDGRDPNVIQYRYARDNALGLASTVIQCSRLRTKERATLQDCLRWNAYAISMLNSVPQEMIRKNVTERLNKLLAHTNDQIRESRDASLLVYIDAPETFPHDKKLSEAKLDEIAGKLGEPVRKVWWNEVIKVWKERAAAIVGDAEVKRQWRLVTSGKTGDGNFIEWCEKIGAVQATAAELREAGLIYWELPK